jgi:hypothetical protein
VSKNSKQLVRRIAVLVEANDHLCDVLERQRVFMVEATTNIETGGLTIGGLLSGGAADMREELTTALDDFEVARHAVRLSLYGVLGTDQGESISQFARSLGISRQLASRLAREAAQES